jgi:hypothetical protein
VARFRLRTLRRFAFFLLLAALTAIVLRWISLERWHRMQAVALDEPIEVVIPEKTPAPSQPSKPPVISGRLDTARLFSGRPPTNARIRRVMSST